MINDSETRRCTGAQLCRGRGEGRRSQCPFGPDATLGCCPNEISIVERGDHHGMATEGGVSLQPVPPCRSAVAGAHGAGANAITERHGFTHQVESRCNSPWILDIKEGLKWY